MKEIITWTFLSGILFIGFITTIILGVVKQNNKLILISVGVLVFFVGAAAWTGYNFTSKSYNRVSQVFKPRTGAEIYSGLFGKPAYSCVKIINYQDQVIPKIDYAICLQFETCPGELKRVLSLHNFEAKKQSISTGETDGPIWFKPETLGDSVLVFNYSRDEYGNGQTIYSSLDSTKVFCIDILD